jgi:death-on-curing protein
VTGPASGTEYLGLEDLLDLVDVLGAGSVRDMGLLDAADHRPQASLFGQEAYPALAEKAAALIRSLAGNP